MRLKPKHWELGRHFERFIDRKWYPDFRLNEENIEAFIKMESYGIRSLSAAEQYFVKPLLNGKINKELTIKMIMEECAEWWAYHHGWYYPIAHVIHTEFQNRSKDRIFLRALIKIMRDMKKNGFQEVLSKFTGLSKDEKMRYIDKYYGVN